VRNVTPFVRCVIARAALAAAAQAAAEEAAQKLAADLGRRAAEIGNVTARLESAERSARDWENALAAAQARTTELEEVAREAKQGIDALRRQADATQDEKDRRIHELDLQMAESAARIDRLAAQLKATEQEREQLRESIRALDAERVVVRETVAAYRETLALTQRRFAAGDVGELEVARVRTEVAGNESQALALDRARQQIETALAVLTGDVAGTVRLPEAQWTDALPAVPAGLPSAMLQRRPDVAAARASYEAQRLRVGIAQTAWFPSLSLTAAAGGASTQLSDLFKGSAGLWAVNALLNLPLLDGGRREAGVQSAAAQADEAAARYREQVLEAFKDVEDQLSGLTLLQAQRQAQAEAVTAAERALALTNARYRNGAISQLDLLDSQRTALANQRAALQVKAAQFQATIALVKALGGGWSS